MSMDRCIVAFLHRTKPKTRSISFVDSERWPESRLYDLRYRSPLRLGAKPIHSTSVATPTINVIIKFLIWSWCTYRPIVHSNALVRR